MAITNLEGRVALVTGAARGIGLAMCHALVEAGAVVVMTDQDPDVLAIAARDRFDGQPVHTLELDVRSAEAWETAITRVRDDLGAVHILCNNAGMGIAPPPGTRPLRSWEVPVDKFRQIIEVNMTGTLLGMRTVIPWMIRDGGPAHIVNTASMAGHLAPPFLSAYSCSKFGVVGLSEATAAELVEYNIGLSILCPGGVATPFNESARRFGTTSGSDRPVAPALSDETKMDPASIGRRVVTAIQHDDLYVFTHPEYEPLVQGRHAVIMQSFGESAQPGYRDPQELVDRSTNPLHPVQRDP